jgi:hypothetical protein
MLSDNIVLSAEKTTLLADNTMFSVDNSMLSADNTMFSVDNRIGTICYWYMLSADKKMLFDSMLSVISFLFSHTRK